METIPDIFRLHAAESRICLKLWHDAAITPVAEERHAQPPGATVTELTHAQLHAALVNKSRVFARDHGLRHGDTIALVADNSLEFLILVYAALFAGLSVFVISTKTLPEHLRYFIKRSQSQLLFCSADYRALCEAAAAQYPLPAAPLPVCDLSAFTLQPEDLRASAELIAAVAHEGPAPDDTAVILHTSGTTRTPKLVYLSHRNVLANQLASDAAFRAHWNAGTTSLAWLPLFHGYALLAQFLRDMLVGGTYILLLKAGQVSADALLVAIDASGANALCCVPWMLNLFREKIAAEEAVDSGNTLRTLQRLDFIVTGGSNLGETLGAFFRERDVRIVTMFGLSEAAGFVLHSPFDGSAWDELLPNAPDGVDFVPIEAGAREHELVITGADLFSRKVLYPPAEGAPGTSGTHLGTGDLFLRKGRGWAYLGRGDQIYNGAHGEKVNPLLFENGLENFVGVERVFVFGEELSYNVALVKLKPGLADDAAFIAQMRAYVGENVNPALESPDRVFPGDVFILRDDEAMPLTPKGSVDRAAAAKLLKARIAARNAIAAEGVADAASVTAILHGEIATYCKASRQSDARYFDSTLLELGFDSLMTLSLRNNLQQRLKLNIPIERMLAYPPLRELEQELIRLNAEVRHEILTEQRPGIDADGFRGISVEQVLFHKAYYLFPGPTFGGSFSLVAPRHLTQDQLRRGLRFLERNHEVLRSVYREDGSFRIADDSMVERAFITHVAMQGSHDLNENMPLQQLIQQEFALQPYDFENGPAWRWATVDITNAAAEVRTMLFIGINHIIGDFRSFSQMVREYMRYVDGIIGDADVVPDDYRGVLKSASPAQIAAHLQSVATILTAGLDQLPRGIDARAGARLRFNFRDIDMGMLANVLRAHNISVFNGVYAAWIVAASRYIDGHALDDFPSVTSVTTRIAKELETVMGCFVHTPPLRFSLDRHDTMKAAAGKVQVVTLDAFKGVLVDPVGHFAKAFADPRNVMPIIRRNVFLYRSPDELIEPVPEWGCYRNDYFEDRCNVGAYFDFCANRADNTMEGYLTVNLRYCSPQAARKVLDGIERLMKRVLAEPELNFEPVRVLAADTVQAAESGAESLL